MKNFACRSWRASCLGSATLIAVCNFVFLFSYSPDALAGNQTVQDNEDGGAGDPVQEEGPLAEFSMVDVSRLKFAGGNYWLGYFFYDIDLEEASMRASWNIFECTMMHHEAEVKLTLEDLEALRAAVETFRYEALEKDYECFIMADGDESRLTILRPDDLESGTAPLPFYPMKSFATRCEGKPVSDLSYKNLEDAIYKILPPPTDSTVYAAFDPTQACPSR